MDDSSFTTIQSLVQNGHLRFIPDAQRHIEAVYATPAGAHTLDALNIDTHALHADTLGNSRFDHEAHTFHVTLHGSNGLLTGRNDAENYRMLVGIQPLPLVPLLKETGAGRDRFSER